MTENTRTFRFDEIDSTNVYLKNLNPKHNLDLVITKTQTNGKGRRGNKWISEEGSAIFSIILEDKKKMEMLEYTKMPLVMGIAVLNGIKNFLVKNNKESVAQLLSFKWTNDVYLNSRKITGILVEKSDDFFIVGVGTNLNNKIPEELKNYGISIFELVNEKMDTEELIFEIVSQVKDYFYKLQDGKWLEIIKEINSKNLLKNREISVHFSDKILKGTANDILENGCLEFFLEKERMELSIGEVHLKL